MLFLDILNIVSFLPHPCPLPLGEGHAGRECTLPVLCVRLSEIGVYLRLFVVSKKSNSL